MFTSKVNRQRRNSVRGTLGLESLETRRLFAGDVGSEAVVDPVGAVSNDGQTIAAQFALQESSTVSPVSDQVSSHDPLDTNGDGRVTANDALLVINYMGRQDPRFEGEDKPPANLDALAVINQLAERNPDQTDLTHSLSADLDV